jgi:hypothetical protein
MSLTDVLETEIDELVKWFEAAEEITKREKEAMRVV